MRDLRNQHSSRDGLYCCSKDRHLRTLFSLNRKMTFTSTELPCVAYRKAHGRLRLVIGLVAIYGTCMVLFGRSVALPLFDLLGFGPNSKNLDNEAIDYSIFMFSVVGAIIVGWMTLMWNITEQLALDPDANLPAMARQSLSYSTVFLVYIGHRIQSSRWRTAPRRLQPSFCSMSSCSIVPDDHRRP